MTVIHDEDFVGKQRVIYQSNYKILNEIIMRGYKVESQLEETSRFVVAKFKIRPKDFSTTILNRK